MADGCIASANQEKFPADMLNVLIMAMMPRRASARHPTG
jgi:hypothetical protein